MIKSLFPKLRIVARDNVIRVLGDEEEMAIFEEKTEGIRKHILKYNAINEEDILDIIKGKRTKADAIKDVIVYNITGKPIKSRSENQQRLVDAYVRHDLVFAVGRAGTGKTYLSIALAVKALKEKTAKKIILSRPAVEAGEKLGFLPGDMKEKIDPYLQPLYDALEDMIPAVKLQDMMEKHVIQIAPLAFMRGRTLTDAIVILDEEHHYGSNKDVSNAYGYKHQDDCNRRPNANRPAKGTKERFAGGIRHLAQRKGHCNCAVRPKGYCATQARYTYRKCL